VDTDAHNIARLNALWHNLFQRLIDENRISRHARRRGRKHKQPSRSDDRGSKRIVAGIDEMNAHWGPTFPGIGPVVSESISQENVTIADISLCTLAGDEASAGHCRNHTRRM
jgi:hypothetical protein